MECWKLKCLLHTDKLVMNSLTCLKMYQIEFIVYSKARTGDKLVRHELMTSYSCAQTTVSFTYNSTGLLQNKG